MSAMEKVLLGLILVETAVFFGLAFRIRQINAKHDVLLRGAPLNIAALFVIPGGIVAALVRGGKLPPIYLWIAGLLVLAVLVGCAWQSLLSLKSEKQ